MNLEINHKNIKMIEVSFFQYLLCLNLHQICLVCLFIHKNNKKKKLYLKKLVKYDHPVMENS